MSKDIMIIKGVLILNDELGLVFMDMHGNETTLATIEQIKNNARLQHNIIEARKTDAINKLEPIVLKV